MINYAVIGRNFVADWFIEGAEQTGKLKLLGVYSRKENTAREYALKHGAKRVYTSLDALAGDKDINAVYIASPNACHFGQALFMLNAGKHVIVEKPAVPTAKELDILYKAAEKNNCVFMEAMVPAHFPSLKIIKEFLPRIGKVRRAIFIYCQYSSRYDRFKNGEILNAFRPELCNGALMDIGIYCIHMMIMLFGKPKTVCGESVFLKDRIDGEGIIVAGYDDMQCELIYSKISDSVLPSEIQGEQGSILIDSMSRPKNITLKLRNGTEEIRKLPDKYADMFYEAESFSEQINGNRTSVFNSYTSAATDVLESACKCMNINFGK